MNLVKWCLNITITCCVNLDWPVGISSESNQKTRSYLMFSVGTERNQSYEISYPLKFKALKLLRTHLKTIPGDKSYYSFTKNATLFPHHFHDQYEVIVRTPPSFTKGGGLTSSNLAIRVGIKYFF